MAKYNYTKICGALISDLPSRQKEIILRRFALKPGAFEGETLEAIGEDFGITRERVRQIEADGLAGIREKIGKYKEVFSRFKKYFLNFGDLKKGETALSDLGGQKEKNQVAFLLEVSPDFEGSKEDDNFYSFWTISKEATGRAKNLVSSLSEALKKESRPLSFEELKKISQNNPSALSQAVFLSYLEISKEIQKSKEGFWGLRSWPEINPRGIKDKIYLVFKKEQKPLHFTEISSRINGSLVQTVHNELIRDPRFVLIGRGIYALSDWGYEPGQVKDVILKIFQEAKQSLSRQEILALVQKQRLVKETTVFLNLGNKKYFSRNLQGKYFVNEA